MSRKLTDMRCGEVVRTDVESLPAVLSDRCRDIETLYHFVGRNVAPDAAFGLDYLQWLWSAAAQKAVPLMLVLWKFESDDSLNPLVGQFAEWVRKQYRKPPFHFICALGEVCMAARRWTRSCTAFAATLCVTGMQPCAGMSAMAARRWSGRQTSCMSRMCSGRCIGCPAIDPKADCMNWAPDSLVRIRRSSARSSVPWDFLRKWSMIRYLPEVLNLERFAG